MKKLKDSNVMKDNKNENISNLMICIKMIVIIKMH